MECKVAFVTGASSGIGRATAEAFVANGYATAFVDRDAKAGEEAVAALQGSGQGSGECCFIACDVADDESVRSAVAQVEERYGRLDAAFNAAGINGDGAPTADCTMENWNRVLAVNLTGTFSCLRYQIPAMLRSGGGAIVNCASVAGLVGSPYMPPYVASKHGVVGLTKAAALEYTRQGVRVNAVCPGMIDTPMTRDGLTPDVLEPLLAELPIGRQGRPEEVAAAVLWLCGEGASYLSGQAIPVDGAWTTR